MINEVQEIIKNICSNVKLKEKLGSIHQIEDTNVKVEIQFDIDDNEFYVTISGELHGRELHGLGIYGSAETLYDALVQLQVEVEDL